MRVEKLALMRVVELFVATLMFAMCAAQISGGGGVEQRTINDITFYLNELVQGQGPCYCPQPVNDSIVPECIARMAERCAREAAGDVDWVLGNGGFASLPDYGHELTRQEIEAIFAVVQFGPCNVFYQEGYNVTIHSAWTRTYTCGQQLFTGVESVETVVNPATELVQWNWISLEPYWSGLDDCLASAIPSLVPQL